MSEPPTAKSLLRSIFGFPEFRGAQAEIVDHICAGGDALVLMPTGGGFYYVIKSVECRTVDTTGVDASFSSTDEFRSKKLFSVDEGYILKATASGRSEAKRLRHFATMIGPIPGIASFANLSDGYRPSNHFPAARGKRHRLSTVSLPVKCGKHFIQSSIHSHVPLFSPPHSAAQCADIGVGRRDRAPGTTRARQ